MGAWFRVETIVVAAALMTAGCGKGGDSGPPETLEDALMNLGVELTDEPRVDPQGEALPDDYAPLGPAASFGEPEEFSDEGALNRTDEILFVGLPVTKGGPATTLVELSGVEISGDFDPVYGTASVLHSVPDDDAPWVGELGLLDATAGDVDADGLDETIVAYVDTSVADRTVHLRVIDDLEGSFAEVDDPVGDGNDLSWLAVTTADVDGDGAAEVVLGVATRTAAELWILAESDGDWTQTATIPLDVLVSGDHTIRLVLSAGNLDYDNGIELGVVVNESTSKGTTSRYAVFDDGRASFAELDGGTIEATSGATRVAGVGHISFGDVDGDGLQEVVLGGLTDIGRCTDSGLEGLLAVLDDARNGLGPLASIVFDPWDGFRQCPAFAAWRLEHMFAGTVDLDGDGLHELYANQYVFEDLATSPTLFRLDTPGLDDAYLLDDTDDAGQGITYDTVAVATGDVTGDGRENLLVYAQHHRNLPVFGMSQIAEVGFDQLSEVPTSRRENLGNRVGTVLVPTNVDMDGPALIYGEGSHTLVFTEPVIVAALAAAPCAEGVGQNVDACSTSFGTAESAGVDASLTVSVRAGIHASVKTGGNVPLVGEVGAEFKKSVTLTASLSAGISYTVEKSQVFTAGPLEDAVVFTTIPYDQYTYAILSHPDPELVGGEVVVSLPREPLILKVERSFYNANVIGENVAISSNVFDHTVGDVSTYPSASRKDSLLGTYGGLENGPIGVGEGNGSSGLSIEVGQEVSAGGTLGIEVERSVEVTGGRVMAGYSVGYGVEASLTLTSGSSTTYSVTVGDLSSDTFIDHQYAYGIFTYVQGIDDQEFEVVNFWVE